MGGAFFILDNKKRAKGKGFWVIKYKREFQTIPYFFWKRQ